jgi:hypothetical protein
MQSLLYWCSRPVAITSVDTSFCTSASRQVASWQRRRLETGWRLWSVDGLQSNFFRRTHRPREWRHRRQRVESCRGRSTSVSATRTRPSRSSFNWRMQRWRSRVDVETSHWRPAVLRKQPTHRAQRRMRDSSDQISTRALYLGRFYIARGERLGLRLVAEELRVSREVADSLNVRTVGCGNTSGGVTLSHSSWCIRLLNASPFKVWVNRRNR